MSTVGLQYEYILCTITDMSFDEIRHKGKPVKRDGFAAKNYKTIMVAVEHNTDGSVTVCKEIADAIYNDQSIPEAIRNYFKPSEPFKFINDSFEEQ